MKLILNGGGSGKKVALSYEVFDKIIDKSKPLLYIPLAMDAEKYPSCLEWITEEMKDFNFPKIDMVNSAKELTCKNLLDYCAIFIGGGNTYKLLKELKETSAFLNIREYLENGGVIYGGSAGAIIFGKSIDSCACADKNDVNLLDTTGFNLVSGASIDVHYTNKNEERTALVTDYLTKLSHKESIIAIPEECSIYINDGIINIIGTQNFYIFKNGVRYKYKPNIEYKITDFIKL